MEVKEPVAKYLAKPAYKQTEAGVIPQDWEVLPLYQLAEKIMVGIASAATHAYRDRGVLMFRNQNIKPGNLDDTDVLYIDEEYEAVFKNKRLKAGDLLTARTGYPGTTAIVPPKHAGAQSFTTLITRPRVEGADSRFLCQFINSESGRRYFDQAQIGGGQKNVNAGALKNLPVCLPPTVVEQKAIAEALSDADTLIQSLEQLLAKKRQIKQGAMQELLTGRRRLPGFDGGWQPARFGDIVQLRRERIDPRRAEKHDFCVELEHIDQGTGSLNGYTATEEGSSLKSVFREGDVLFGKLRAYLRKYWLANQDGVCSTEIWVLVAKRSYLLPQFLFQLIKADHFIATASSAYGTHMPRSDWNVVKNYEVTLPPIEEQTAIATLLADIDADIAALEARLAKARSLTQGMMQELLTGRIRLVLPKAEVIPFPVQNENSKPAKGKSHNWQINEAVVISVLAKHFGSEQWPLGRKRYTKLSYLLHRHVEHQAEGYLKKAAGPYNPATKYKGPEGIALKNGYIRQHARDQFSGFVAAEKIGEAEDYFIKWYGADVLAWLKQFRIEKNDELELLATVDMAMEDLRHAGDPVMLDAVKQIIQSHPEWQAKLDRPIFSDANIERAIVKCHNLFGD